MDERRQRELGGDVDPHEGEPLTPREEEVMRMSEEGMTTDAMETELGITHRTLRGHLARAWAKLAPGRGRSGAFYEFGRRTRDTGERSDEG